MGQKISDGKAPAVTFPASEVINDYDLYRVNGWNGCAIGALDADDTARTLAFEMDTNAVYSVKLPGALNPAVGAVLYWATPGSFQRGDTHLQAAPATAGDPPAFKVLATKNAAGYAQGRVLNNG